MFEVTLVTGGYANQAIIKDLSFSIEKGEFFGILGPNGSGKTTLLKLLSRILRPTTGDILLNNRSLDTYQTKEFARLVAVLPQMNEQYFSYTVRETVAIGRYAHQKGLFTHETKDDRKMIEEAMEATNILHFQNHTLQQLSGGERQRVFLAQALAQEPEILLLDEPTNHLDLSYQKSLLEQLSLWTKERKLTVVSVFHDINIASLFCDRLLFLKDGEMYTIGKPEVVISEETVKNVYYTDVICQQHPQTDKPQIFFRL